MIDVSERLKHCYESCDVYELLREVEAERDALTAKVAELEKDAARWQKLRAMNNHDLASFSECMKRMKFSACEGLIDARQPIADGEKS